MQSPIQMQAQFEVTPEEIQVAYVVKNESTEPIMLLDTHWNRKAKAFDPNWALVEIRGSKALLKRIMETKPKGLMIEHPPAPYGRELAPGDSLEGKFTVPLPLVAFNPYDFYVMPDATSQEVDITDVGFMMAWTTVPPEPLDRSMRKIVRDGMTLQPFSYYFLEGKQRFLMSEPVKLQAKGIVKIPPSK